MTTQDQHDHHVGDTYMHAGHIKIPPFWYLEAGGGAIRDRRWERKMGDRRKMAQQSTREQGAARDTRTFILNPLHLMPSSQPGDVVSLQTPQSGGDH